MSVGRPYVEIDTEEVDVLRDMGYTWAEVAVELKVSVSKINTWKKENYIGIDDPGRKLPPEEFPDEQLVQ